MISAVWPPLGSEPPVLRHPPKQRRKGQKSCIITVELLKADKVADKPAGKMENGEKWAFYFQYLTDKSKREKINEIAASEEGIAMASTVLATISRDESESCLMKNEE